MVYTWLQVLVAIDVTIHRKHIPPLPTPLIPTTQADQLDKMKDEAEVVKEFNGKLSSNINAESADKEEIVNMTADVRSFPATDHYVLTSQGTRDIPQN